MKAEEMPAPRDFLNVHEAIGQLMNHSESPETVTPTQAQTLLAFFMGRGGQVVFLDVKSCGPGLLSPLIFLVP